MPSRILQKQQSIDASDNSFHFRKLLFEAEPLSDTDGEQSHYHLRTTTEEAAVRSIGKRLWVHNEFEDRRVNAANMRKEFFRVSLDEVEESVKRLAPEAEFHRDIEAQEFNETLAKRRQKLETEELLETLKFPNEI